MWELRALSFLLLFGLLVPSHASPPCPYLGPVFPKPQRLSSHPAIRAAVANLTTMFDKFVEGGSFLATNNSWAVEIWAANEAAPLFSDYHTATNLPSLNSYGVTEVGPNTIFRLGSFTKVFTVLTWLAQDGDIKWTTPITQYVPELVAIETEQDEDAVKNNDWESITIGALMSQMSGIIRDYSLLGELTQTYKDGLVAAGFPPLSVEETPQCGQNPVCSRKEFFEGLRKLPPTFSPDLQPAYSNIAYQLVAYAMESITGKSWESVLNDKVLQPLGLRHTYYQYPPVADSIIPGNLTESGWINLLGDESPAGSMHSSAADLTAVGKAILTSKLISKTMTSRWLKPVSFTSDPQAGMGTPWGIRKIQVEGHQYRYAYGFQKGGRIGDYASYFLLLPDWDVGFTILNAGDIPYNLNFDFADGIGEMLIPLFEQAAREEAHQTFAGTYITSNTVAVSSYMTITTDNLPGLSVSSWMNNGTNMLDLMVRLRLQSSGAVKPRVRLYPSGLETVYNDGSKRVSMKATFEDENVAARTGKMFSTDCATWLTVTSETYGRIPTDEIVFNFDSAGRVVSVEPVALRTLYSKTSDGGVT